MTINEIENIGVIGAGGAGFPTHVKLNSKPDTIIMNAAECEPLLHKDMELILNYSDEILKGLKTVLAITGAKHAIVGIGLNINQTTFNPSVANPSSFKLVTGKNYDLKECLGSLCSCIEARYLQLKAGKSDKLHTDYLSNLYRFGQVHQYIITGEDAKGTKIDGVIEGVSDEGRLQLRVADTLMEFGLKEVRFVVN